MWLVRLFVKEYEHMEKQRVRESCGRLAGVVGIVLNLLLSGAKLMAGALSGAVSVLADALNNLTDAASSVITILSFRLSGKPADDEHPFGHARAEYLFSIVVASIIFIIAFQLLLSSVSKVLHPSECSWDVWTAVVLVVSIAVKLWMFRFNRSLGKRIQSTVMQAAAMDSLSDVYASAAVLLAQCLSPLLHFSLDGYVGLVVVVLIAKNGIDVLRDALDKLLGPAPSKEMVEMVAAHVLGREGVLGMHDLMLHSYGPGRHFATAHVEVEADGDLLKSHDMIDNIEREIAVDHGIHLVLHLDPVVTNDERISGYRTKTVNILRSISPELSMHDFRMAQGPTHTNLIFDVVVPHNFFMKDKKLLEEIIRRVREMDESFYAVVTLDRNFTGMPSNKIH